MITAILLWLLASVCFAGCWSLTRGRHNDAVRSRRARVDHVQHSAIAIHFHALTDSCAVARLISVVQQTPAGDR